MGQWVGSGQMTNLLKLELIDIIQFFTYGWVNGWAHVKSLKANKS